MASLNALKQALKHASAHIDYSSRRTLSDDQYAGGFSNFNEAPNDRMYRAFITPTLTSILGPLFDSRLAISVLEIGPGPKTILASLPEGMKRKIKRYKAFEPNEVFAKRLDDQLGCVVRREAYELHDETQTEKFDVVLFCHSMYGMHPKRAFIEQVLESLGDVGDEMVVVFHRDGKLDFGGLVCYRTATWLDLTLQVPVEDERLDEFVSFIVGFDVEASDVRKKCRDICHALGTRTGNHLVFYAREIMVAFNKHATALPKLLAQVPAAMSATAIKNREARILKYAAIVTPNSIPQVQECVQWARKYKLNLTVIGGSHSGQCVQPNVVGVDMSAFNDLHVLQDGSWIKGDDVKDGPLVIMGAGSTTGQVVSETLKSGMTIPLGSRPSVGAGLWLQGGIGHLSRRHGLSCDSVLGVVMVSPTGEILHIGHVPPLYLPRDTIRPDNEAELLWAVKGAGTNFGIVISVVFRAYNAPKFLVREWVVSLGNREEAVDKLAKFNEIADKLERSQSADPCLHWDDGGLRLGVTMYECSNSDPDRAPTPFDTLFGKPQDVQTVDCKGLFDTDMYMSRMHGGHAGGKTSSFKRCVFLKDIGNHQIADLLVKAIENRPTPTCYLHLLQGGGAIRGVADTSTAFGCRDWDFACVITGIWPRDEDGTEISRSTIQWVYNFTTALLPLSQGIYGADLGPDPRDKLLVSEAFGPNRQRLARLKKVMDPQNVLAYACPLPKNPPGPKLIFLVTGNHGAGKDYCAEQWASEVKDHARERLEVHISSISDATKRAYAASTGADLARLLNDRAYKEQHRAAMTAFFKAQVQQRPNLPKEHFLDVVYGAAEADVLFITGMRDPAPVAMFSHLVPGSRVIEVRVRASEEIIYNRRCCDGPGVAERETASALLDWCPDFDFDNNVKGPRAARSSAEKHLSLFLHGDAQRLADMVRAIPDFPVADTQFRHVLGIVQEPDDLALCLSLLKSLYPGDMSQVDAMVCCEAGGFLFASPLASSLSVPLVIVRNGGKLPPPTLSVTKLNSHISSYGNVKEETIEIERDAISKGASVLVVDDVLASGQTLCAVLQLLDQAGIQPEKIQALVVAEFPIHGGRALLRSRGFGTVSVRSLLIFGDR
ncbi:hypothetical protein HBH77_230290 [Parastagonospora nodorum]|nr:hypothetical protein HBH77_230290 [Parastagonospora nodorum]KAH5687423.1 hypothetical protein HBI44_192720 [Parastagonospora nodorum]